jgi:hypothetical protein
MKLAQDAHIDAFALNMAYNDHLVVLSAIANHLRRRVRNYHEMSKDSRCLHSAEEQEPGHEFGQLYIQ